MARQKRLNIVVIGGGTGSSLVAQALRVNMHDRITIVCSSGDSGGSTAILRKKLGKYGVAGFLGDASKCLCALSPKREMARDLMLRFDGALERHSLKNLLLARLIQEYGVERGFERLHEHLGICPLHRVMPVTNHNTAVWIKRGNGRWFKGEGVNDTIGKHSLFDPKLHRVVDVKLEPPVPAHPRVLAAIAHADYIIISFGDLYTSVIPALLADGVARAIKSSPAKVVMLMNMMTKQGETDNYEASDFVRNVQKHIAGRLPDIVLCNKNGIPTEISERYRRKEKKVAVVADSLTDPAHRSIFLFRTSLSAITPGGQVVHDVLKTRRALNRIFASSGGTGA